jgi:lipopolysaccharide/colanic/teichoic acid biosynthesis glycosyltransferase
MAKRGFDILCSAAGLIVLLPLFVLVALLIRIDSRGPVFFRQTRVGKGFRLFSLYKFRSMVSDAAKTGPAITAGNDSRITRMGKVLRKTKIDELPQLINVLKGDMSLVGPRPEVMKYVDLFRQEYDSILTVRPGITDFAAIEFRDEEQVLACYALPEEGYVKEVLPQKIELYRKYIQEQSFFLDLRIIFSTLRRIV